MRQIVVTVMSSVFLLAAVSHVGAAPIQFDNRTAFEAVVSGAKTVTFDDVLSNVNLSDASYDAGPFTVTGPDSDGVHIEVDGNDYLSINGTPFIRGLGVTGDTVTFTFDAPITSFGVDMFGINNDFEHTRIVIDGTTYQFPVTPGNMTSFFGLVSDVPFSIATFYMIAGEVGGLDNITFGTTAAAVPEPTSIALLATGLAGALLRRRRRA
jgi:hypothetical protein